jgi:hypothetical protein
MGVESIRSPGKGRGREKDDVKVTMLLADAAQVSEGKLNVLGGGWSVTGPNPTPSAIAIYIQVPWDQAKVARRRERKQMDREEREAAELAAPGGTAELPAPEPESAP